MQKLKAMTDSIQTAQFACSVLLFSTNINLLTTSELRTVLKCFAKFLHWLYSVILHRYLPTLFTIRRI